MERHADHEHWTSDAEYMGTTVQDGDTFEAYDAEGTFLGAFDSLEDAYGVVQDVFYGVCG